MVYHKSEAVTLERAAVGVRCFRQQGVTGTCVFGRLGEITFPVKKTAATREQIDWKTLISSDY